MKRFDYILLASVSLLILAGLATLYSIGLTEGQEILYRQLISLGIGIILFLIAAFFDYRYFLARASWLYIIAFVLLILVLIVGQNIRGSTRWIDLGFFTLQPSEIAKIAIILGLAKFFAKKRREVRSLKVILHSGLFVAIFSALVMIEPDLGSAVMIFILWLGLILMTPIKKTQVAALFIALLVVGAAGWYGFLHDYQKERIQTFLNPQADPLGSGYNVNQSIIAVGSGLLSGRGLGRGFQSHLSFLPERHTDFIFASFAEELGFIGSAALIALFGVVVWRLILIAKRCSDSAGAYIALGLGLLIMFQTFINIGMNIGLMPVTGITLPFLSYGGTSLISTLFLLGLVQSVYRLNMARG